MDIRSKLSYFAKPAWEHCVEIDSRQLSCDLATCPQVWLELSAVP